MTPTFTGRGDAAWALSQVAPLLPAYLFAVVPSLRVGRPWAVRVGHPLWTHDDGTPDDDHFTTITALEDWARDALGLRPSDPLPAASIGAGHEPQTPP